MLLSDRHRIPSDIVEKLMLDQYATPILVFEEHIPLVNMLQCSLKAGDSDFQLAPENLGTSSSGVITLGRCTCTSYMYM